MSAINTGKGSRTSYKDSKLKKESSGSFSYKHQRRSGVLLSNDDVSIISVIVQQKGLPRDYLIEYARESGVSKDAIDVLSAYLDPKKTQKAAHSHIASEFKNWVNSFSNVNVRRGKP